MTKRGEDKPDPRERKFRKPKWVAPPEEEPELEEPLLPSVGPARSAQELAMFLKPLSDLSDTFRENSEALRSLAEGQSRIAKRLERADKSDVVVRSTDALNETFRGVKRTQERLMTRLEREKKRPWLVLLGVVIVVGVLIGGAMWLFLRSLDRRDDQDRTGRAETIANLVSRHDEVVAGLQEQIRDADGALLRQKSHTEEQRGLVAELEAAVERLETENDGLQENKANLSGALRESARLRTELDRLTEEASRSETALTEERRLRAQLEEDLRAKEQKLSEMARRAVRGGPGTVAETPRTAAPAVPEPEAPRPSIPSGAVRNSAELARLASVLNGLLAENGESDSYEFESIGGVRGKVLYEVVVVNRDRNGKEVKRMEAAECRVVLDAPQRRAEIRFQTGHIVYYGVKAPFWGGQFVVPLVNVSPESWRRSGLTILDEAR